MGKNRVVETISGAGTYTVPAGVKQLSVYGVLRTDLPALAVTNNNVSLALTPAGTVLASGVRAGLANPDATLAASVSYPVRTVIDNVVAVYGRNSIYGVLDKAGKLYIYGSNNSGEVGDGSVTTNSFPIAVASGLAFIDASLGNAFSVAVATTGDAYAWGLNSQGQLGDNSIVPKSTPVLVSGGHSFIQISAGQAHVLALKANGEVWSWGRNTDAELGDNTVAHKSTPVQVVGGLSFVEISAGVTHSMARQANGNVYCWGSNLDGECGNNAFGAGYSSPVQVVGGLSFAKIRGGNDFSFGLLNSGVMYSWGRNVNGSLGDGTTASKSSPILVAGGRSYYEVQCNTAVLAISRDGAIYGWGTNTLGVLAIGNTTPQSTPVLTAYGQGYTKVMNKRFLNNWEPSSSSVAYDFTNPNNYSEIINGQIGIEYSAIELVYFT